MSHQVPIKYPSSTATMPATEARCWSCGAEGTHCLAITERDGSALTFMVVLCNDCRGLVTTVLGRIKAHCERLDLDAER